MATRDERKQTSDDASKRFLKASEPESHHYSGISVEGTCLLAMRCPAYRGHDSYPGFRTELENRVGDAKGKRLKCISHEAESTDAPIRGALLRSSEEAG
jgi:hypothetical protein